MRVSPLGAAAIAAYEALVPAVYIDRVASPPVATFGIGHTHLAGGLDPRKMPLACPAPQTALYDERIELAIQTFVDDLRRFEARVAAAIRVPLQGHEFDALVKFDFNTGAIHKAKLTEAVNARASDDVIRARFMAWSRAGTNRNILAGRREAEADMFLKAEYPNKPTAVWRTDGKGNVAWSRGPSKSLPSAEIARMVEAARQSTGGRGVVASGGVGASTGRSVATGAGLVGLLAALSQCSGG